MNVLDKGWVVLVESMGSDLSPAEAARVSYNNENRGWDEGDGKLTSYLLSHHHDTPFEMAELKFKVKAPIFVARQWMRHRSASYNEFSMRYSEATKNGEGEGIDIYIPEQFGVSGGSNKQGSASFAVWPEAESVYMAGVLGAVDAYTSLIAQGVSREHARLVLPVSTYTIFMYKTNLRNFWHFLDLRSASDAQREIREYANAMAQLAAGPFPNLMKLYDDVRSN